MSVAKRQPQGIIAFMHIEKTAGISMNRMLRQSFGIRHCDVELLGAKPTLEFHDEIQFAKSVHPTLKSVASHWLSPARSKADDLLYYTFLRHPLNRTLSHYQYQIQRMGKSIEFEEWIEIEKYRNFQTKKIAGEANVEKAISIINDRFFFVGITEYFQDSLNRLNSLMGGQLVVSDFHGNRARDNQIKDSIRSNEKFMSLIDDANTLDNQLYEYFLKEYLNSAPTDLVNTGENEHRLNYWANRIFRNVVYKPLNRLARLTRA